MIFTVATFLFTVHIPIPTFLYSQQMKLISSHEKEPHRNVYFSTFIIKKKIIFSRTEQKKSSGSEKKNKCGSEALEGL